MPRSALPTNLRGHHTVDDSSGHINPGTGRDIARSLLGSTEDACLLFFGTPEAARLAAVAVRESRAPSLSSSAEVPYDVKETIRTGIPRTVTWPDPRLKAAGAAHRSWRIADALQPCHGLVIPLDTGSRAVGALVVLRCGADREPYTEDDVDAFRLAGLRVAANFEAYDTPAAS